MLSNRLHQDKYHRTDVFSLGIIFSSTISRISSVDIIILDWKSDAVSVAWMKTLLVRTLVYTRFLRKGASLGRGGLRSMGIRNIIPVYGILSGLTFLSVENNGQGFKNSEYGAFRYVRITPKSWGPYSKKMYLSVKWCSSICMQLQAHQTKTLMYYNQ